MLETQVPNRFSIFHRGPSKGPDFEAWREGICRGFCRLDVGPAEQDYIDCHNEFAQVNSIAVATPKGGSARFARTRDLLTDGCDDLVLISATRGTVRVTQRNKAVDLTAGQMCLTEMNVVGYADLTRTGGFTTARFPRRLLLQVAPLAETQLAQPLGHDRTLNMMIDRYFRLCHDVAGDLDILGQRAAEQHLTDLVGLLLGTRRGQKDRVDPDESSAGRLNLVKTDVLRNLERNDLTIESIARANALSARQAQRLFASSGTTFSEFVLEQRLLLARRLLLHEQSRHRKVSDIAYTVGFNDLSYFHKSFRRRFGMSPADMRAEFRHDH
jgi:AraC-like DNA-binding protein